MTCGEAVMKLLSAYEVDTVFGMAGTMTVELYRGMALAGIRHVQCRNEQGASLMADGYARATGKPGVCTIIAGPGVTNAATGIAQAYCDSQPMLVLSGACATLTHGKGWGAIHELDDQAAVTAGFTAFSAMVRYPEELPELIARAYAVFRGSRPRPVHLSLPRDVLPGAGRGRLEDPPHSLHADARSGGDRRGRGAPRAGQAPSDSRRRRRGRHARGADRHRRASSALRCLPPMPAREYFRIRILCPWAARSCRRRASRHWREADVVLLVGSQVSPGDHFLPKLEIAGDIIRIDIDPARTDIGVRGGGAHSGGRPRRDARPCRRPSPAASRRRSARRAKRGCGRSSRAMPRK